MRYQFIDVLIHHIHKRKLEPATSHLVKFQSTLKKYHILMILMIQVVNDLLRIWSKIYGDL